jgi:phosphopantetheinyl transferase (holo-ACP synthase)
MGYSIDSIDSAIIEDYFLCRKKLIDDQQFAVPYGNKEYQQLWTDSYTLQFALNKATDAEIERFELAKTQYPSCIKFNLKSSEFKKCSKNYDESRQCYLQIAQKKIKKEASIKSLCQKKSYIKFPDSFLQKNNDKKNDIQRTKTIADIYNQNNFASIGLDQESLNKFDGNKITKKGKSTNNFNSKDGLYSKLELALLRQKYAQSCQKDANKNVENYVTSLNADCITIVADYE